MAESVRVDPELLHQVASRLDEVSALLRDAEHMLSGLEAHGAFESPHPDAAWSALKSTTRRACTELEQSTARASDALRAGVDAMKLVDARLAQSLNGFVR